MHDQVTTGGGQLSNKAVVSPTEIHPESFRFPKLRAASTPEHYALHIAALEWSLDSPITIRGEADIQSKRLWADRFDPFAHQIKNLITFCRRAPVALLADDVGLGKTISAGLILSELMVRKKVSRALVVAPKLLLPQWQEELAIKFSIPAETATGAQLTMAMRRGMPVVVSTYQSIRSVLDELRRSNFDMVILDEAHKLRNLHGTAQAPQFAEGIRKALADRVFKYVLMLTATPIQNRLWDLYSLIDLLTAAKGHTNPLGSPGSFKSTYIEDARAVQIRRGRKEEFRQHLSNYIVRTRRSDANLVFPSRRVQTHRVAASPVELKLLMLVGELLRERSLNGLTQSSIGQALMSSPQALASQLEEMGQRGTVPRELAIEVNALVKPDVVSGKLTGLVTLIQELASKRPSDWRLVVFTSRVKTQEAIGKHLKALHIPTGFIAGSRAKENERAIRAFKENPPGIRVLVSTDAGAEGINLQVANVLVNFDLPWNPMVLEQRIGRIQRLASTHAEVTILNLVLAGSVEEKVVARLGEKLQAISESMGDIEGILESVAKAGEEEDSFEAMIRKLVVDSLRGVDVELSTRCAMQSIEEAKEIFEAERETVEKTLGDLNDLHRTGPRVPEISPVVPSVEAKDFVMRALTRDGARIRPVEDDQISVKLPGQNEFRLTFKERSIDEMSSDNGVFGGNAPRPFIPGKRDFERLAQSWTEKSGSFIVDRSRPQDSDLERLLTDWLVTMDGFALADFKIRDRHEGFCGELTCRASVAVSHDRLEKLLKVPVRSGVVADVESPSDQEPATNAECDTSRLDDGLRDLVTRAIALEPDLIKFSDFYRKRLAEELPAAGDPSKQRRLREQFTPVAAADAVAVRGLRYAVLDIEAQILIDGEGPYSAGLKVLPGATQGTTVTPESQWTDCQSSGRSVPVVATDICTVTGKRVLLHLMSRSAASGQLALKQYFVTCEATDVLLLFDETEVCTITGRRVRKGHLGTSAVSGRSAMPSEFVQCDITGANVLPDELAVSAISGMKYRSDQTSASTLSGRLGHASEFVHSVLPQGLLARDEAAQSDVSGTWADARQLVRSSLPPGRLGLPSESLVSEVSNRVLLQDEVQHSDVSGRKALPEELVECEFTGSKCLPSELETSKVSGRRYRSDQQASSVQSARSGHREEFVLAVDPLGLLAIDEAERSEVSDKWALKGRLASSDQPPHRKAFQDEMVVSTVSGKQALPDEIHHSVASGKPALQAELEACDFSGDLVLPGELIPSQISGKRLRTDRSCTSVLSGRVGHPDEFATAVLPPGLIAIDEAGKSDLSGVVAAQDLLVVSEAAPHRRGLPAEFVVSAVSGKKVLRDEVRKSDVSDAIALPEELEKCEFTSAKVLPKELIGSDISGKKCRHDETLTSVISGRRGHFSEFVRSVAPSGWIAIDEAAQSAMSGEWGAKASLIPSARLSHRIGLAHELVVCELTGQRLLRDEVAPSAVSGKLVDDSLLVQSAASGKRAIAEELVICEATGKRLLPIETSVCAITSKRVDVRELTRSEVSGLPGLGSLMVRCSQTGKRILPSEAVRCDLTAELVLNTEALQCVITGRNTVRTHMRQCPTSGGYYINDQQSRDCIKALTGLEEILGQCQWTGRTILNSLLDRCSITSLRVERTQLNGNGELSILRQLLDGNAVEGSEPLVGASMDWLRGTRPELRYAKEATACRVANSRTLVAAVKVKAGLIGLTTLYFAVAAHVGKPPSLLCDPIAGKRGPTGWTRQSR